MEEGQPQIAFLSIVPMVPVQFGNGPGDSEEITQESIYSQNLKLSYYQRRNSSAGEYRELWIFKKIEAIPKALQMLMK